MATAKPADGVSFDIHVRGSVTGKTWDGTFRAKALLSFREQMNADKLRRELIGPNGENAVRDTHSTAVVISELAFRLTEFPEWWKESQGGLELADPNVLEAVYKQAMAIETAHLEKVAADGEAAKAALRSEG